MQITATVEQFNDGSWTATAHIGDELIIGDGDSQEAAIASLRDGLRSWVTHMKETGATLPQIVILDVAA